VLPAVVSETEPVSDVVVSVVELVEVVVVVVSGVVVVVSVDVVAQFGWSVSASAVVPGTRSAAPSSVTAPSQPNRRSNSVREW
jgi:hypothetical protein